MSAWDALEAELDRWAEAGRIATLWWRDDDAGRPTAALTKLLDLSQAFAVPLALAVIPAEADEALPDEVSARSGAQVLQHGFAHVNHAPPGEKKAEYGEHRPLGLMGEEIASGIRRLAEVFDARFVPVFVPPWNRVSAGVVSLLPTLGFAGLSAFAPRPSASPAPGLGQVNTHVDLIDWRGSRRFKGAERVCGEIAAHLRARRTGQVDDVEPSGLLSHHRIHDEDCWRFMQQLFARTRARENLRWLTPREALET